MSAIRYSDRVLAVGMTTSGKSELIRALFARVNVRRALVDPKGEWRVDGVQRVDLAAPDVMTASGLAEAQAEVAKKVNLESPIIHVRPRWQNRAQLTALYGALDTIPGPLTVWTDEAYGVSNASWAPPGLLSLQTTGAGRGHGHFVATQRPRNIAKELVTEATHLFLFPPIDVEDLKEARRGMAFLQQDAALELLRELPDYHYLWADRGARRVVIGDPLPPEWRELAGGVTRVA